LGPDLAQSCHGRRTLCPARTGLAGKASKRWSEALSIGHIAVASFMPALVLLKSAAAFRPWATAWVVAQLVCHTARVGHAWSRGAGGSGCCSGCRSSASTSSRRRARSPPGPPRRASCPMRTPPSCSWCALRPELPLLSQHRARPMPQSKSFNVPSVLASLPALHTFYVKPEPAEPHLRLCSVHASVDRPSTGAHCLREHSQRSFDASQGRAHSASALCQRRFVADDRVRLS